MQTNEYTHEQQVQFIPFFDKRGGLSVCKVLNISKTTAKNLERNLSDFPKPITFSPTCQRYKLADVLAWADGKRGADLWDVRPHPVAKEKRQGQTTKEARP